MMDDKIAYAIQNTEVLRRPKQTLSTFGTTTLHYYVLTQPAYRGIADDVAETVIREGKIVAERPRVVTPYYLMRLEGFSDSARRYLESVIEEYGTHSPGIMYKYTNEHEGTSIVSEDIDSLVHKLNDRIDREGNPLSAIIKGVDEMWDVSLMKFIYSLTEDSVRNNIYDLGSRGLLDVDNSGVPLEARQWIEVLFHRVKEGEEDPSELKRELDRWGLSHEYEDRFFDLFRRLR